ncbi:hypothetical protein REIP_1500 [Rickettsia endosymbiont of Ixodes pacificus]|nr:hypothetical protein REIP_1500 [Rickettsia endosymbiont of Ixodes pacificus]
MHTISIKYFYEKINKILERHDIYFLNLSIING